MKTEFLKELGLEQETISKIMAENGKDIEAEKKKTQKAEGERDNYKSQLETATEELEKFKDVKPEEMQATIEQLQNDLKARKVCFCRGLIFVIPFHTVFPVAHDSHAHILPILLTFCLLIS